jgi:hypothetical protein
MELMKRQAERFRAEIRIGDVTDIELTHSPLRMTLNGDLIETKSLIVRLVPRRACWTFRGKRVLRPRGFHMCHLRWLLLSRQDGGSGRRRRWGG